MTELESGPDILEVGYVGYFRHVMDAAAIAHQAHFWLEKSPAHTLLARFIKEQFPDANIYAMTRNSKDVVAFVYRFGKPNSFFSWFRTAVTKMVYKKIITANKIKRITYEDILEHYETTISEVFRDLGLHFEVLPESQFRRNTSFEETKPPLRWWQNLAMWFGRRSVLLCSARFIEQGVIHRWLRKRRLLPSWFFLLQENATS